MSYFGDTDIGRNQLRRVEVLEIDDSGGQQVAIVQGLAGEVMKLAYRGQYFGATGVPPVGSDGFAMLVAGRPDQAVFIGIEHPDHRYRNLKPGEKAIYDAHGQVIKLLQGKKTVVEVGELRIIADKVIVESSDINLGGEGGVPVAKQGTLDTAGHACVSNLSTTTKVI